MMEKPVISVRSVSKAFPGVQAVDDITLDVNDSEVLALLGENGAGKSTLMKVICGILRADKGDILMNGRPTHFNSAYEAIRTGISAVYQELSLVGSLSVAENIYVGNAPQAGEHRMNWPKLYSDADALLRRFNLRIEPQTTVKQLSMGQRQMVEILKAVATSPRLLILDEPTSSLTDSETECLFGLIRELKSSGVSFIYITHKLSEVFEIADRAFVMRDGKAVGWLCVKDTDSNTLISMMVGRTIKNFYGMRSEDSSSGEVLLGIKNLSRGKKLTNINFDLHRGEILGFAGLVGSGRTEMALSIFGADPKDEGIIEIAGKARKIRNPADAIRAGMAYLTEDRKEFGLYLNHSVRQNLLAPNLRRLSNRFGIVDNRAVGDFVGEKISAYNIVVVSNSQKVATLSGGNQQKCLYSMWIGTEPDILILDEPTRGIDVGTREEMYRNIRSFAARGGGVLLISSDMPELIGLSDRIIVMHAGRIQGELSHGEFSERRIMGLAAGIENTACA